MNQVNNSWLRTFLCIGLSLFWASSSGQAQENFEPGSYVTAKGDRIRGFIAYDTLNPDLILFKPNREAKPKKVLKSRMQGFQMDQKQYVVLESVPVYMGKGSYRWLKQAILRRIPTLQYPLYEVFYKETEPFTGQISHYRSFVLRNEPKISEGTLAIPQFMDLGSNHMEQIKGYLLDYFEGASPQLQDEIKKIRKSRELMALPELLNREADNFRTVEQPLTIKLPSPPDLKKMEVAPLKLKMAEIPHLIYYNEKSGTFEYSEGKLVLSTQGYTGLYKDPLSKTSQINAPKGIFKPDETFQLIAKCTLKEANARDLGGLVIWLNSESWAQLSIECENQDTFFVHTTLNYGYSDRAQHAIRSSNAIYFRVARFSQDAYVFYYSSEGTDWKLLRYFYLSDDNGGAEANIGFFAASPQGKGSKVVWEAVQYLPEAPDGLRKDP